MLVRDAPQLEVFMLRRNLAVEFMGGAYVFPGGAVDAGDRAPELLGRCHGRDDSSASTQLGMHTGGMGFWVAAIRETFEEAGVLLARSAATGRAVGLDPPAGRPRPGRARRARDHLPDDAQPRAAGALPDRGRAARGRHRVRAARRRRRRRGAHPAPRRPRLRGGGLMPDMTPGV